MGEMKESDAIEFLDELLIFSINKIKEYKDQIQKAINNLFETFINKFKEEFPKQKNLLKLYITKDKFETFMVEIKEQLKLKFEKLESLQKIIKDFQISPDLIQQINLAIQNKNTHPPTLYKKIRKEKKEEDCVKCPKCNELFQLIGDLRIHLNKIHNTSFSLKCPHCHVTLNNQRFLANHIFNSHGVEQLGQKGGKTIKYPSIFSDKIYYSKMLLSHEIRDNVNYHIYD